MFSDLFESMPTPAQVKQAELLARNVVKHGPFNGNDLPKNGVTLPAALQPKNTF